jgi:hypothetical protein
MKDAPDEGFRPGRTGSSLLWDEGNRRDGDQPARRVRTRRGGEGCGGHYAFVGGSDAARAAVHSALDASRFDWDLVEQEITIRITDCGCAGANPGEIILDEDVLTDLRFGPKYAWGIVQHEYAHQVDFFLLDARDRRRVRQWLGGSDWCYEDPDVDHDDHACERFASSLAWAYWARPRRNIMAVHTAVTAAEFREVLPRLLGPDDESIASQGLPRRRSSPTLRQVS